MSKDQSIGGMIFVACVIIALGYIVLLLAPQPLITLIKLASLWKDCNSGLPQFRCDRFRRDHVHQRLDGVDDNNDPIAETD